MLQGIRRTNCFTPMSSIAIERASPDDAAAFARMERDTNARNFVIPNTETEHLGRMADNTIIYLRIILGELLGFIILALDSDGTSVEFRRIVVAKSGHGVGQRAIKLMEEFCTKELRRFPIWLDVFEHNQRPQHIYEKLGYSKFGETFQNGRQLYLYEKNLHPP